MQVRWPQSWPGRLMLVVLASILVYAAGITITHFTAARAPGRIIEDTGGRIWTLAGLAWATSATVQGLRRKPDGPPDIGPLTWQMGILGVAATWALLFLATQGTALPQGALSAHVNFNGWMPSLESLVLAYGLLYALLLSPEIIRRKLPFEDASEQVVRWVPATLALGAAIVTGSYLLCLHFFNEPLARLSLGPLTASIVAVMALLTPFYQLIARACWRYGLADLLDPTAWWAKWSEMTDEIRSFRIKQASREVAEKRPANTKRATWRRLVARRDH
jgi:hypothetical protein